MNMYILIPLLAIIDAVVLYICWWKWIRKTDNRPTTYRVRATVGNVRHTLTLNEEQYARFRDWVNGADGYFDIGDESEWLVLERKALTCVEVTKRG